MNGRSDCPVVVYVALAVAVVVSLATPQLAGFGWSTHATVATLRGVWGDLDGDGRNDQLNIEHHAGTTLIGIELSAGLDEPPLVIDGGASIVSVADVDGDGDLDLITASLTGSELWLNDGHGVFTLAKRASPWNLAAQAAFDLGVDRTLVALATSTPSVLGPMGFRLADGVSRIRAPGHEAQFSDSAYFARLLRGPPPLPLT